MAITSKSTLRDVLADPRAVAVIEEYVPGFVEEKADLLGPVLGMKINMLLKFPQAGFKKEDVADICAKLDALDADWVKRVNRPQCPYRQEALIEALKGWEGECIIQTMFLRGTVDGVSVDNTTDDFVKPWLKVVADIRPKCVSIYSLDRDASCTTLLKADPERLLAIGERVKALGIPVQVSVKPSEVRREKECD